MLPKLVAGHMVERKAVGRGGGLLKGQKINLGEL